jgi:hypothetical protein
MGREFRPSLRPSKPALSTCNGSAPLPRVQHLGPGARPSAPCNVEIKNECIVVGCFTAPSGCWLFHRIITEFVVSRTIVVSTLSGTWLFHRTIEELVVSTRYQEVAL